MSMHSAVQRRVVNPPLTTIVNSRVERVPVNLEVVKSHATTLAQSFPQSLPEWMQPAAAPPVSRLGKGGAFAVVVLIHALGFYVLSKMPAEVRRAIAEPLQVLMLSEPEAAKELPPPPVPVLRQDFSPPSEPVINVAVEQETTSITVVPRTETSPATASIGAPKWVSTVEYFRKPIAKYPTAARALKQRGTVVLRALIDVDGQTHEVNVQTSSGSRLLDDAGRAAVLNALFKPYTENGRVVPVYVLVPIEFNPATG